MTAFSGSLGLAAAFKENGADSWGLAGVGSNQRFVYNTTYPGAKFYDGTTSSSYPTPVAASPNVLQLNLSGGQGVGRMNGVDGSAVPQTLSSFTTLGVMVGFPGSPAYVLDGALYGFLMSETPFTSAEKRVIDAYLAAKSGVAL